MAGYIGTQAVSVNTTSATISDDLSVGDDALITGTLTTTAATVFSGGFASNDGSTISTADNTVELTLTSTSANANSGPIMNFYRNSASPAAGDSGGLIEFIGKNDAGQDVTLVQIEAELTDVADGSEDVALKFGLRRAGAFVDALSFDPAEVVFNDSSIDMDFRVESNINTNALFVDGATGNVGIGRLPNVIGASGSGVLTVRNNGANRATIETQMETATTSGIYSQQAFYNGDTLATLFQHGGDGATDSGYLKIFTTATGGSATEKLRIHGSGAVTKPKQPAFLARPASTQSNLAIGASTTIAFGTEVFDQNADFASNTFTAPVTGKYQLDVSIYFMNLDHDTTYYQLELVTSNRIFYNILNMSGFDADVLHYSFPVGVTADMDADDTAFVRMLIPNDGAAQADVNTVSHFSGHLVC